MIAAETKTAFRFYDSLDKQNRFKSQCAAVCDFKFLVPISSLLPFQFDTGKQDIEIDVWRLMCAADDTDMGGIPIEFLEIVSPTTDYIIFEGLPEESESAYIPSCGSYYFQIETNQGTYYSEVFQAEDISDPTFVQSELPIFTSWRFYDNILLQNKYKSQCAAVCDFTLISEVNTLLPFQFRIPGEDHVVDRWVLRNDDCEVVLKEELIEVYNSSESLDEIYDYIFYTGEESPMPSTPLVLPNGNFSGAGSWVMIDSTDPLAFIWSIVSNQARFRVVSDGLGSAVFSNQDTTYLDIIAGEVYTVTYTINSISGPAGTFFALRVGGTKGEQRYEAGTYTESLMASENGFVQLYAFKPEEVSTAVILVDNISVALSEKLPCGTFESVVTVDGVDYFSEWINIVGEQAEFEGDFLLQEDGFMILQENGFGILLE